MHGSNRLINETSPYLLQHSHNPVDWFPWGEEALNKARVEDKPILVSIGYAACHWCHVMERESFEDERTAEIMNHHFVSIKIDREERPDLDHIYMDAVQALTGSGGWPLNVFLTPAGKPFYGGTYFPPSRIGNRPSWLEVLLGVADSFAVKRKEIDEQAENLTSYLVETNTFGTENDLADPVFNEETLSRIYKNLMKDADRVNGGFGRAPKFPQSFTIQYLLRQFHFTKNTEALDQACLSLDKMICGGICDQLGGGFSRYSTDDEWLAPHFEKMLYDNALLVSVLSEAYQLTHKELYKNAIDRTMTFILREMTSPEIGFYAALDADSEGEEGKFYVWNRREIEAKGGEDAALFCEYYNVSAGGNWEGKNILRVRIPSAEFASLKGITEEALIKRLDAVAERLLRERSTRIRPALDDKILLNWNALFNTACSKAYAALGTEKYLEMAIDNMQFMLRHFYSEATGGFLHTYKNGTARYPAFLDDYACLIQALINLQEVTGDEQYLRKAAELLKYVIEHFSDAENKLFYFTHKSQKDLVVRKKEVYDGATPSANALMAENLFYLAVVFDNSGWKQRSIAMLTVLSDTIIAHPSSFGIWANFLQKVVRGVSELALLGISTQELHKKLLSTYIPNRVLQVTERENPDFPLLAGKLVKVESLLYICRNYACQQPVTSVELLLPLQEN